jgi:hypothetical protein
VEERTVWNQESHQAEHSIDPANESKFLEWNNPNNKSAAVSRLIPNK